MDHEYATKYPMDIPHVTAVELPLNVKNPSRAISMLGGKERIRMATNAQYRPLPIQVSSHSVDERNLELRLRKDPFHHPVQATVNRREKVLVKVSVPKLALPADYHANPGKYLIRELLRRNKEQGGPEHRVEPVSIVNKNYNFRAMADFQMLTKNNATVQRFNADVLHSEKFEATRAFYHETLTNKDEYKEPGNYENRDHQLVPPPHFSAVRFPFDYKYKKNSFTMAIRDGQGDVKMVMKNDSKKLFTNTVDYHKGTVPDRPLPAIVAKYTWLQSTDLSHEWADKKLYECIQHLHRLFALKPIWLRKALVDVLPDRLKLAVKEALPYVSYCYKNGPWRFCNVRLGVDPTADRSFWMFQSEYFRLYGINMRHASVDSSRKVLPNTIAWFHPDSDAKVSECLLFTGTKLPAAINYQLGDILDPDIHRLIQDAQAKGENHFFRTLPDPQDGWITRQMMGTVRGVVRYKLRRLQHEEPIEASQIAKIIATDYTLKDEAQKTGDDDDDGMAPEEDEEDEDDEDGGDQDAGPMADEEAADEEAAAARFDEMVPSVSEEYVINRVKQVDEKSATKLLSLVGLIKQDALNQAAREQ
ncbi:hypothetical protein METBIDRAFT_9994 [Metschnikowia bicuspidata var. bicuspidata NRRL YB-4993]|uniref:Transcription factor IIIC subunit 5 HTH domain-containing protein n=1 Tax=Metschnikowia bicuspidata var. bicuspidata NRRL YB-4993 TaxID=869754 RepID=A0A1A0HID3_9ASCO|nr:hypothetical protein METBIDRAFT_9994 [Metschnikowia bicuspidata var. bicuspidata NRRL YB-4993]OBA23765.1 hypothetical protein METBIDRAFT_9994 [Metschnikowia bicuspidata var. bicuspidata NRRL YB-4993]